MGGRRRAKKARPSAAPPQKDRPKTKGGQNGSSSSVLLAGTDTALKLLQDIKAHRKDPRDLTPTQRRSCLMLLANGSQTSTELAAMFKTSPSTIRMDLKTIRAEVGREVRDWTTGEVVGQLALMAEKTTAGAMAQGDPGLAWTIQRDFARLLKELGVVRPEVDQSGFRLTVEAIGGGYDRAKEALQLAMNPTLTGQLPPKQGPTDDLPVLTVTPSAPSRPVEELAAPQVSQGEDAEDPAPRDHDSPPDIDPRLLGF